MSSHLFDIGAKLGPASRSQPDPPVLVKPKRPQAADPRVPSLACLGDEIIMIIAGLLQDTSPKTISSLALVCSAYHRIARYVQHQELVLENSIRKLDYVRKSGIPQAIRKLEIRGNQDDGLLSQLCELIPKMTGLKHISWLTSNMPIPIIQLLRERPSIRLHVEITDLWGPEGVDLLRDSKNLTSLKVAITYFHADECLRWTKTLKCVLLSCPNLRKLGLNICLYHTAFPPLKYCGFGFVDGEHPPALEELELEAYPFGIPTPDPSRPNTSTVNSTGYPLKIDETDYWKSQFDWSQLRKLTIRDADFAMQIMPQLTSLEAIGGFSNSGSAVIRSAFDLVPSSLSSIDVPKIADIGLKNLLRHGSTLRSLTIHQDEDHEGKWRQEAIDSETLIKIRDQCPHIEELSLDISRNGAWPYEMLDILSSFPSLRSLTLWFELGQVKKSEPIQPYVTFSAAGKLFQYLHERTTGRNTRIRKLNIMSGSTPKPKLDQGYPPTESWWASCNISSFICSLSDRDDDAENGVFSVTCPKLGQLENEYLRRHAAGEKNLGIMLSLTGPLSLERDGPVPMHEW
ncbi:hypothetical protein F5B19DRAFT_487680 [Rostrohypoxylon terebratum]|nr:hypothetical protein F5B19DRAFT_487680 [Rostrohypoxylon terebratum]